jgi:hypothetical protein
MDKDTGGKVKFNEKEITKDELNIKIEEAKKQKGVKIVEIAPNEFKQRLQD